MRYLVVVAVLCLHLSAAMAAGTLTVTVLPFSQQESQSHAWVGTAIADLLMQNLVEVNSVYVLDRDRLQSYLREIEFQQSGFVSHEGLLRLGRIAKVDQVISGYYSLSATRKLSITLQATQTDNQGVIKLATVSGELTELSQLIEQLAVGYLQKLQQKPEPGELERIRLFSSTALPVMAHFYRGLNHYDEGDPAEAFAELYLASQADPDYLKARLWMGEALLMLERREMAIALYRDLYVTAPNRVESLDAQLKAAELLLEESPDDALPLFMALMEERQGTPHRIFAAMRLGQIYTAKGEWLKAFTAYAVVDKAREEVERQLPSGLRERDNPKLKPAGHMLATRKASLYAPWEQALALYRPAIQQMALLYAKMVQEGDVAELPAPPRGVLLASHEGGALTQQHRTPLPSLFHERLFDDAWREDFYVVVMPRGFGAKGGEVSLQGKLLERRSSHDFSIKLHEFPLSADTTNHWLGVLYGQSSELSRLNKAIPFYGKQLPLIAVQLVENHGKIYEWSVTPQLEPADAADNREPVVESRQTTQTEGVLLATLPLLRHASGQPQLITKASRRLLALASGADDTLTLVSALKDPDTQRYDLFVSNSADGDSWSPFQALPVNSLGDDLAPTLIAAEDGSMHLYWLSNRRGDGWSLWHSKRARRSQLWSLPGMVQEPLASSPVATATRLNSSPLPPYAYSITQDRRGRWLLASNQTDDARIELLVSTDTQHWEQLGLIANQYKVDSLALGVDTTDRYHLASFSRGKLLMRYSNDANKWQADHNGAYSGFGNSTSALYPTMLRSAADGRMTLLYGDSSVGIQFSRYRPHQTIPASDLVKDADLLPYAATPYQGRYWLMALAGADGISIRRYQGLHAGDNPENSASETLYHERDTDAEGNQWQRIFPRARMILPDVTAIGVADNGRLWWGIETGIMSLHNKQFTMMDVADGFFNHHVTAIQSCGERVVFAAGGYNNLKVGVAVANKTGEPHISQTSLGASGQSVTAMACLKGEVIIATSAGTLRKLDDPQWQLDITESITALQVDPHSGLIWLGTRNGSLYRVNHGLWDSVKELPSVSHAAVTALAVSQNGKLWVAQRGEGVNIWDPDRERWHTPQQQPYRHIGAMVADPSNGVWLTAGDSEESLGLAHHDGSQLRWFNPPSHTLKAPVGLTRAPDGSVWVGTAFKGLYQLKVKSL